MRDVGASLAGALKRRAKGGLHTRVYQQSIEVQSCVHLLPRLRVFIILYVCDTHRRKDSYAYGTVDEAMPIQAEIEGWREVSRTSYKECYLRRCVADMTTAPYVCSRQIAPLLPQPNAGPRASGSCSRCDVLGGWQSSLPSRSPWVSSSCSVS